jgi:hypothetical protein
MLVYIYIHQPPILSMFNNIFLRKKKSKISPCGLFPLRVQASNITAPAHHLFDEITHITKIRRLPAPCH